MPQLSTAEASMLGAALLTPPVSTDSLPANPRIEFDPASFHPMHVLPVRHNLANHPLLDVAALVEVAQRLQGVGTIRFHDDRAKFDTSFVDAPNSNPVAGRPKDIVRSIESAHAWLALLGVHNDPAYRELMDEALDPLQPIIERLDDGVSFRGCDIFVASPGAVTPYHMDHNHNFILQVRGNKLLYVCEPLDRAVVTEDSLELFHATGSRDLVVYKDEFLEKAHHFDLQPGQGAYMPTTAPHWVKNGDNVSITISFTFYSDELRRRKLLHRGNYNLRKLGLRPPAVGESPARDAFMRTIYGAAFGARDSIKRARGAQLEDTTSRYCK